MKRIHVIDKIVIEEKKGNYEMYSAQPKIDITLPYHFSFSQKHHAEYVARKEGSQEPSPSKRPRTE